jgi:hypothetical protein
MQNEYKDRHHRPILLRSALCTHHSALPHAARLTLPPCTFVDTGPYAGPLCLRGLNQNAVNHTVAPAGFEISAKCRVQNENRQSLIASEAR